jgi:hypothetical protein
MNSTTSSGIPFSQQTIKGQHVEKLQVEHKLTLHGSTHHDVGLVVRLAFRLPLILPPLWDCQTNNKGSK